MRCQLEPRFGDDLAYLQPVVEVLPCGLLLQLDDVIADFVGKVDGHLFQRIQLVLVHAVDDVVHITLQFRIVHGVQLLLATQGGVDDVAAQFQPVLARHQRKLLPDKLLILGFHFGRTGRTRLLSRWSKSMLLGLPFKVKLLSRFSLVNSCVSLGIRML